MPLELQIDRSSEVPVYRQIIEKIASLIRAGSLKPGDRLPPERELSQTLGIARGTITRAYEELTRNGIIEVAAGRGSFVSARQDVIPTGRKERAVELIHALVKELVDLRFSYREIKSMVNLVVLEREEQLESLSIAVVDCSPEALSILYRQLGILSRINSKTILLADLVSSAEPEKRLSGFDLILTTATHYAEVLTMAPGLKERMLRVVVSPSQETIIHLAALNPSQTIGIVCESPQFLAIVKLKLDELCLPNSVSHCFWPWAAEQVEAFLAEKDVLIVPPVFPALLNRETAPLLTEFTESGGRILPFDYQNRARLDGLSGRADQGTHGAMKQHTIVLGVIGSDCHSVGNKILDAFFSRAGLQGRQPGRHGEPGRIHQCRDREPGGRDPGLLALRTRRDRLRRLSPALRASAGLGESCSTSAATWWSARRRARRSSRSSRPWGSTAFSPPPTIWSRPPPGCRPI